MITVWIPEGELSTFEHNITANGNPTKIHYQARMHNGHRAIDVSPAFFQSLVGSPNGLLWQRLNPKTIDWLGGLKNTNTYQGQPFPDESNPPPIAAMVTDVTPAMVRMRVPQGTCTYSHNGTEYEVGKDGMINVAEHVADVLKSHGFHRA